MADRVRKVRYCYVTIPSRAGQGAKVLAAVKQAGVNLLGFSGFPARTGAAQLDLLAEDQSAIRRLARREGWRVSRPKKGFLVQGTDVVGAVDRHVQKLAGRKISITAAQAVSAGGGRYGMMLWVKSKDYVRAARALKAR
jgi:hypothetical protein